MAAGLIAEGPGRGRLGRHAVDLRLRTEAGASSTLRASYKTRESGDDIFI